MCVFPRSLLDLCERSFFDALAAFAQVKQAPWDIKSSLPSMDYGPRSYSSGSGGRGEAGVVGSYWDVAADQGMWAPYFFQSFLGTVHSYAPWMEDLAAGFFTLRRDNASGSSSSNGGAGAERRALTAGNLLHDMLVCDFDSVMFCGSSQSRERKNIFVCMVVAYAIWYVVGLVIGTVPGAGVLYVVVYSFMWVLVPITAVQLSYGMAATCFPMLPTCLLQDLVVSLQATLPISVRWPDALQRYPGCIAQTSAASCLRSCRAEPFYFQRWEDSVAWALCASDVVNCTQVSVPYAPMVRQAAWNYSAVAEGSSVSAQGLDLWHAHQFCFVVTLGQALPWLFVFVAGLYVGLNLLKVPFVVLAAGVQFAVQAVSFTHVE